MGGALLGRALPKSRLWHAKKAFLVNNLREAGALTAKGRLAYAAYIDFFVVRSRESVFPLPL